MLAPIPNTQYQQLVSVLCGCPLHVQMGESEAGTSLQKGNAINPSLMLRSKNYVLILAILTMNSAGFIVLQQPSASLERPAVPCRIETILKDIVILLKKTNMATLRAALSPASFPK